MYGTPSGNSVRAGRREELCCVVHAPEREEVYQIGPERNANTAVLIEAQQINEFVNFNSLILVMDSLT